MAVSNGQSANQTTFNNAFVSRTQDSNTTGRVDLENTLAESGPDVVNAQREINSLGSFTGRLSGTDFDAKPTWTNTDVGSSSDDLKTRADLLTQKFNFALGHKHTGAAGDAPQIDGSDIVTPLRGYIIQGVDLTAVTGGTHDVSSQFTTKVPSINSTTAGIPTTAPYNRVLVRFTSSNDPVEDAFGNQVYARVTNTGGVGGTWTLTFYAVVSGTETAYSFTGSNNLSFWYQELFNPLESGRPVYSEDFFYPSDNLVADMPDAAIAQAGKVSTGAQSFGGEKNFDSGFATEKEDVSSGTLLALSSSKSFVRITGATPTTLSGILAPVSGFNKRIVVTNASTEDITVEHQAAGAAAANRVVTSTEDSVTVEPNASIEFIYDDAASRWKIVSSGVGGNSLIGYPESLGSGNGINDTFGPLTFVPVNEDSVWVFVNGLWIPPDQWSLLGSDIVFGPSFIPGSGQYVSVHYLTQGVAAVPVLPSGTYQSFEHLITSGEATAKQVTISPAPASATQVTVFVKGGAGPLFFGDDYTISGSTFDWATYSLDGILVAGDKLRFIYVT